jgi:hypothetical protein
MNQLDEKINQVIACVSNTALNEAIGCASIDNGKIEQYTVKMAYNEKMMGCTSNKINQRIFQLKAGYYSLLIFYELSANCMYIEKAEKIEREIEKLLN